MVLRNTWHEIGRSFISWSRKNTMGFKMFHRNSFHARTDFPVRHMFRISLILEVRVECVLASLWLRNNELKSIVCYVKIARNNLRKCDILQLLTLRKHVHVLYKSQIYYKWNMCACVYVLVFLHYRWYRMVSEQILSYENTTHIKSTLSIIIHHKYETAPGANNHN